MNEVWFNIGLGYIFSWVVSTSLPQMVGIDPAQWEVYDWVCHNTSAGMRYTGARVEVTGPAPPLASKQQRRIVCIFSTLDCRSSHLSDGAAYVRLLRPVNPCKGAAQKGRDRSGLHAKGKVSRLQSIHIWFHPTKLDLATCWIYEC